MIKNLKPHLIIQFCLHLLFWLFIAFFPIISASPPNTPNHLFFSPVRFVLIITTLASLFYLNTYFLIPEILNKKRNFWLYIGILIVVLIGFDFILTTILPQKIEPNLLPPSEFNSNPPFNRDFHILPLATIVIASLAYHFLADRYKEFYNKKDIANSNLETELAFLRSQISPHFIFNIINSIVSLSRSNSKLVEPTLIQLSKLMRYMLYISDAEKVKLEEKAAYLTSYIDLQRIRMPKVVIINFSSEILDGQKTIEPMLLIPFVENAFKYCAIDAANPIIIIRLNADSKRLTFSVQNTYNPEANNYHESGGIGLKNVKRRLDLLYPKEHVLNINQTNEMYNINLQIQLK